MSNTVSKRLRIYAAFTGTTVEHLYRAWRHFRSVYGNLVDPRSVNEEMYQLGVQVSKDVFSSGSMNR
jgi:hypothetical protein